jgi:hypothetical protein
MGYAAGQSWLRFGWVGCQSEVRRSHVETIDRMSWSVDPWHLVPGMRRGALFVVLPE